MRKLFFILTSALISSTLSAQDADSVYQALLPQLKEFGEKSRVLPLENERNAAADSFITALEEITKHPEAMNFTFEGVSNLSVLTSPDEKLRMLTFMVPQSGLVYKHYGFMLYADDDEYKHLFLENRSSGSKSDLFTILTPGEWYGGLYYDIIEKEKDDQTIYFLLGYRQVNPNVQQKFIDAVTVTEGLVRFGAKAFQVGKFNDIENEQPPYRLAMSYSTKFGATLQWNEDYDGIVMDHVSPPDASQRGFYMVYGPDFSYDALVWKDEAWYLEENIMFENDVQTAPPDPNVPATLGPEPPR